MRKCQWELHGTLRFNTDEFQHGWADRYRLRQKMNGLGEGGGTGEEGGETFQKAEQGLTKHELASSSQRLSFSKLRETGI